MRHEHAQDPAVTTPRTARDAVSWSGFGGLLSRHRPGCVRPRACGVTTPKCSADWACRPPPRLIRCGWVIPIRRDVVGCREHGERGLEAHPARLSPAVTSSFPAISIPMPSVHAGVGRGPGDRAMSSTAVPLGGGGQRGRACLRSCGRSGASAVVEIAGPSSGARVVVSGPARIHTQLRNPGNSGDGDHHTPSDGGDQQRHSQREGAREAQIMNLDARRILQNEDNEHHQEQDRRSGGHPGGADASQPWSTVRGRRAGRGRCILRRLRSRRGRVCRHDICVPSNPVRGLSEPMSYGCPLAA